MERTLIASLREKIGQKVKVQGFLQTLRDQKKMQFHILRDISGLVQAAFYKPSDDALANKISGLTTESALTVTGTVVDNPIVKLGGLELQVEAVQVESATSSPLPFDLQGDALPEQDYRLDWRYFDLRRPEAMLIFKVQTTAENAMREYWAKTGFIEMHSPKITGAPSESGAELFEVIYFERKAYLAQSPQFYKQMAMAAGFDRVCEIGPVFRADPSFTSRHMTEFTGVDMELSWVDSHEDVMQYQERWLQYVYQRVYDVHAAEIKALFQTDFTVPEVPFPRLKMADAVEILKGKGYTLPPEKKGDIDPAGERLIGQYIKETYNHDFVFLTDWPISVRPFYHMRYEDAPTITKSFDLLASGLEITTGAQREHRYDVLVKQALEKGLTLPPIQFYLDFFKYGCPPHGGLGLGLSRLLMVMLGINNIREVTYIFRGPTRLNP